LLKKEKDGAGAFLVAGAGVGAAAFFSTVLLLNKEKDGEEEAFLGAGDGVGAFFG
jgi:hypothetical protein